MTTSLKTPVAFIIFNRPKCTKKVIARIRDVRPKKLYIIADAPRAHKAGEAEKCAETRRIVEEMIDWPCEVHKNYAEKNMGCGQRIPSGLNWVFEQEEKAIIMEDDILADPSFFGFCTEMLDRYEHDENIMQIAGYNRFNYNPGNSSYFYSRYSDIWGWATWRRAWEKFKEIDQDKWESIKKENRLGLLTASENEAKMRSYALDQIFSRKLNAWGMRWELTKIVNRGMGVLPSKNLVKNIGFGPQASHTLNPFTRHQFVRTRSLLPPYTGPVSFKSNSAYDKMYRKNMFTENIFFEHLRTGLLYMLGKE